MRISIFSLLLTTLTTLASAECDVPNTLTGTLGNSSISNAQGIVTEPALCLSQGAGSFTFAMTTDISTLGLQGSTVSGAGFMIMDNACLALGVYNVPSCGIPFVFKENFLQFVLTITSIDEGVGDAFFSFTYANGQFSIGNNGCVCNSISAPFPDAAEGCRCAFPVAGEPNKKRSIGFRA